MLEKVFNMNGKYIIAVILTFGLGLLLGGKLFAIPTVGNPLTGKAMKTGELGMNNKILGAHLRENHSKFSGQPEYWTKDLGRTKVMIVTDESHNRMRVMAPVQKIEASDKELVYKCLNANFDRALDARYAVRDNVLFAAFLHPLSSLTKEDLDSAIKQVETLVENTGTTFSSGELIFRGS